MPFNGSGTFGLVAGNPVVTGTTISSVTHNSTESDIATGLTNCLTRDGQSTPTANLPMGAFKLTGIGNGTVATDSAAFGQIAAAIQAGAAHLLTGVAGTNTITASVTPTLTAYTTGKFFWLIPANTITGAATLNINGVGARALTKYGSTALVANDLLINVGYLLFDDGTRFQVINPSTDKFETTIFHARSSATTSLTDNTNTRIALGTEVVDVGSNFATSFYTVPTTGYYFFFGTVSIAMTSAIASTAECIIEVADSAGVNVSTSIVGTAIITVASNPGPSGSIILSLTAGQRVYLMGYQNNGGARNAQAGGQCFIGGWRVY